MSTLPEREKTLCVQSPLEGGKTVCTVPTRGGKTVCVQSQDISNQVQLQNVYIQEKLTDLPVEGRLRQFLPVWENKGPTG